MKKEFISSVLPNAVVDSLFVVDEVTLRNSSNKKSYISCTVSDRTGRLPCKIWGDAGMSESDIEGYYNALSQSQGSIFRIAGRAALYKGELGINVNDGIVYLSKPADSSKLPDSDFINSPVDIAACKKQILALIDSIGDEGLRTLVSSAVTKADGFFEKPAAKGRHHGYFGGLCEHSLEVAKTALSIEESLSGVRLRRDLLIAGALLHDIGKCQSFEKKGLSYVPLPEYSLLGHTATAMMYLSHYRAFTDAETFRELLHIVQSHHGEHGETMPQTAEAWAVHLADNISAKIHEVDEDLKSVNPGESVWGRKSDSFVYKSASCDDTGGERGAGDNGGGNFVSGKGSGSEKKSQRSITDCFK
ncbi:MAG: HD domain-containing protein [Methanomicrobium sp.]|nr:HD domain-containing protein [Methanomicrobium sp.]